MTARTRLPLVVLLTSLTLTFAAAAIVGITGHGRDQARFERAVVSTEGRIRARLESYVTMLYGTRALFAASEAVTTDDFRTFVLGFELAQRYPGIQGIGYAVYVRRDAVDSLERARRAAGDTAFRVWPDTARATWTSIVFLEPQDERNVAAIGHDMYAEPTRRVAMAAARDGGQAALSGVVQLVQELDGPTHPGFLIYVPVYARGVPPHTVAARRERLLGWVYSPFRAGDLFAGIFGATPPTVDFRVFDGRATAATHLLHDSRVDRGRERAADSRPRFEGVETLQLYGHPWTLHYTSLPSVEERPARLLAPAIALVGTMVSLLLFLLTRAEVDARARAERSEQARGRFYATMSHELRTPLNAVMGYTDLLLADVYGTLSPPQRQGLERSQKAARHLLDIVNDVLDLSKIEAGKLELEMEEVHLPSLVEDLFTTLRTLADEHGATLVFSCTLERPAIVSDARRVRQILLNLLSNAIKFGEGRPIEVRCHRAPAGGVVLEVIDQGTGIAPDDQERIFEEFVQLTNAHGTGTGLGLPISRRLARLLGGELTVESTVGRGSTFTVSLPDLALVGRVSRV